METEHLLAKLTKDVRRAAATLGRNEARFLVDTYYQVQEFRKSSNNQCRTLNNNATEEPHEVLSAVAGYFEDLENEIKYYLKKYVEKQEIGQWMTSVCGIGPVISAGLIAHIDIENRMTAGQIFSYAGLNPQMTWGKGEKRPFNAKLKTLCWKIGESFVKVSNREQDVYGKVYKMRKEYEQRKNEAGEYAEEAKAKLEKFNIGKSTEAYKWYSEGKLPPAHIQSRCKRYAVKLFLSHLHHVWFCMTYGMKPPKPYSIAILNHAHYIFPPNWDYKNDKLLVK